MRTRSIIFPAFVVSLMAVACDNGGDGPDIPRTVPPTTVKGSLTTIDVPALTVPTEKPAKPPIVTGSGPIYET